MEPPIEVHLDGSGTNDPLKRLTAMKERVANIRERARTLLEGGATGIQVAAVTADDAKSFVVELFQAELHEKPEEVRTLLNDSTAVVAIGGTGRGEMAPWSDVDLLFLVANGCGDLDGFQELTSKLVRDCWDAGLEIGHSTRTISEAVADTRQDIQFATAAIEAELLWGSERLLEDFQSRWVRTTIRKNRTGFVRAAIQARVNERNDHGGPVVSQLEPDVKKARGGLRDLHMLRWVGFAVFGTTKLDTLRLQQAIRKIASRRLLEAYEFLLRVRIELHLCSEGPQDHLTREAQLEIARRRGIESTESQRGVERFMKEYLEHAASLSEVVDTFVEAHQPRPLSTRIAQFITSHRADRSYIVNHAFIQVKRDHVEASISSLAGILQLYQTAGLYGVSVHPELVEKIRLILPNLDSTITPEVRSWFLKILKRSVGLGRTLRALHRIRVLELIIPEFRHVRNLLQFNQYHHYTVDEHTFRVIEAAEELLSDPGPIGTAYRNIKRRDLIHLALLLHDIGKGYTVDHCVKGEEIAEQVGGRLELQNHHIDLLKFLVLKHLDLSHLAFRRDYMDWKLLFEFSHDVGSPEALRMLYVLTACDMTGVGPGVWTKWKAEILTDLYDRLSQILSGKPYEFQEASRLNTVRNRVRTHFLEGRGITRAGARLTGEPLSRWLEDQLGHLSPHYLLTTETRQIAEDLRILSGLTEDSPVVVRAEYEAETRTVQYRVYVHPSRSDGCFHRITGALSAQRLEILGAEITTSRDDVVIDQFQVIDRDFATEIPQLRIDAVSEYIRQVVTGDVTRDDLQKANRQPTWKQPTIPPSNLKSRVEVDNKASDEFTVIDVFSYDRPGLLYRLTRTMSIENIDVHLAKIATNLDQVVDVFYVSDEDGRKIGSTERILEVKQLLLDAIEGG